MDPEAAVRAGEVPIPTPQSDPSSEPTHVRPEGGETESTAIDTHCHLFLMEQEAAAVVAAARSAGVIRLVCVGIDAASSRRSVELAQSFRGVFATAGMHPHTASDFDRQAGSAIEELLGDPMVVGVGETGLDYYRKLSSIEDQRRAFRTHIALSLETGKPLVVHVREAWDDALSILAKEGAERVVFHCFSGSEAEAGEAQARGYFVSFAGNLTYPRTDAMSAAAGRLDQDRLLVETDSPFLTPQRLRGQDNTPANVIEVARQLSELRGLNLDEMLRITSSNARRAFPLIF